MNVHRIVRGLQLRRLNRSPVTLNVWVSVYDSEDRLTAYNQLHFSDCKCKVSNRGSAHIFPGVLHLNVRQLQNPVREGLRPTGRQITTRLWPLHMRLRAGRCLATDRLILALDDDEDFRGLGCRGIGKEIIDEEVLSTYLLPVIPAASTFGNYCCQIVPDGRFTSRPINTCSTLGLEVSPASEALGINPWPNGIPNSGQLESLRKNSFPIPGVRIL